MIRFLKQSMLGIAVVFLLLAPQIGAAEAKTLRIATHAALKDLDPIWTTAYIVRNHGYLVYDTLFALDENYEPQPQMVENWSVSDDGLTWTFTLREGLKWHDGGDVTAADCVASLERWGKRDSIGQRLFENVVSLQPKGARSFTMRLKQPDNAVNWYLAKMSANVPFMMPQRVARTDPFTPITDPTGSGPYIYSKDESVPGSKTVYIKNKSYVPRSEESSFAAGGKIARADRIEWYYYPNQADAVQAMLAGKIDYIESLSTSLMGKLKGRQNIVVTSTDPLGNLAMVRFNALLPPFDNAKIRRAVLMALKQEDYMNAAFTEPAFWRTCYSIYPCGTPYASETGSAILKTGDVNAAKAALAEAGYDGTPVVVLDPVDSPVLSAFTAVTADKLRQMGMTVVVQDMDWATLLERRANRGAQDGWNMFHTWWLAGDVIDPTSIAFSGNPVSGWAGWPNDRPLEVDREAFSQTNDPTARQSMAYKVQERVLEIGALGVLGQFYEPVAYRANVTGITSPIPFYWKMSVK